MALSKEQIDDVWNRRLNAETYSYYFGDLASRYSRIKQAVTFITFFLASGAVASIIGKLPSWVPAILSAIVALASAYSVATSLDSKIWSMAKLHYSWLQISNEYINLWNHTYSEDAEVEAEDLRRREQELSLLATTDAPNDQKALSRWQERVWKLNRLTSA